MSKRRKTIGFIASAAMVLALLDYLYPLQLPDKQQGFARVVVDRNGELLRTFADSRGIWRYEVTEEQVSPYYLSALLSYEDRWFYYHPGVNPLAMIRAAFQNWHAGRIVSGGSTLTMQVARLFHPHRRSLLGKLQQILRALQLELHLSKREILGLYLNHAPFGGTREGVQAASFQYLGKSAEYLTRAEATLLAVLPQAPSRLRPDRHPELARQARDKVLRRLLKLGVWSDEAVTQAAKERVSVFTPFTPKLAPLLARRLAKRYPDQSIIQTTIDAGIQQTLQDLARSYAEALPAGSSAAILVVDNQTHEVIGYVGSADFESRERFGNVDMISAVRSPGSTLKPFLYGLAIDAGLVHSASLLSDVPREFSSYRPANFNNGFKGPVSLADALKYSLNIPAVEVLEHFGPVKFTAKLKNAGLNLRLPSGAKPNLSIILGGVGLNLEELVQSYGAFTNKGLTESLEYLKSNSDKPGSRYLMSPAAAWVVGRLLQNIPRPDRLSSNALVSNNSAIGWKSGTSYGFRDAWSVGFNNRYRVGVWVGRPDGTPLPGHYGALSAAPLMFTTFDLLDGSTDSMVEKPDNVEEVEICWPLGIEKSKQREGNCHRIEKAWVIDAVVPKSLNAISEKHDWLSNPHRYWVNQQSGLLVDASCEVENREIREIVLWPKILEPWIAPRYRRQNAIPATDPACPHPLRSQSGQLRISGIKDQTTFRSAGASGATPVVAVRVIGARGKRWWYLNGEILDYADYAQTLSLSLDSIGQNQLVVIDETGNLAKVNFMVE